MPKVTLKQYPCLHSPCSELLYFSFFCFLIGLLHKWGSVGFPEASHQKGLGSKHAFLVNQEGRRRPQRVRLAPELRLHVQKSSLIFYNCLDLFTGKGQVGKVVNKSLTDVPWPWLRRPLPARLTAWVLSKQDKVRFPQQIQYISEFRAPVTNGKVWLHQSPLQR